MAAESACSWRSSSRPMRNPSACLGMVVTWWLRLGPFPAAQARQAIDSFLGR